MRRTLASLIADAVFIRQPRIWTSVAHTNKVGARRFKVIDSAHAELFSGQPVAPYADRNVAQGAE